MLTELSIKNFAIIDDLTIHFSDGLTILSGETGAGKSIIINAINLLLGSRATSKMIRTGADTAEIEALFHLPPASPVIGLLADCEIESGEELLIRRIISKNDRHRIYINGRLSTMQLLNQVTENLAAISGQHEHQQLLNTARHLTILDQFGDILPLRQQVYDCYHQILPLVRKLDKLTASRQKTIEQMDLLAFQKKEIDDAALVPGEDDQLKKEQNRLKNAEALYQTVASVANTLYTGDGAVAETLGEIRRQLESAARLDDTLDAACTEFSDAAFRLEDIGRELGAYLDQLAFDDGRLLEIDARLDVINRLKRKYGGTLDAVFQHAQTVDAQLRNHDTLDKTIADTETELARQHKALVHLAGKLSAKRRELATVFSKNIESELSALKMPGTRFDITFTQTAATSKASPYLTANGTVISETGAEQACFMIAPNVGEAVKPLSQIASGGELSRVILALKSVLAADASTGTMIFDEVDAGIGGEVASIVGKKLSRLAAASQVICITHLAQIAAFGDHHFKISKHVENLRTCTRISPMDTEQRLMETARMLGGEDITPATLDHAGEMIQKGTVYRKSLSN